MSCVVGGAIILGPAVWVGTFLPSRIEVLMDGTVLFKSCLRAVEGKGSFGRVDIFDGARHHDLNLVVRRAARLVERANRLE